MPDNPLISVIVPVYKVEKYLDRCVESLVSQTYRNIEIVLVDNGSPDQCPQLCDNWAEKDSRVKVLHLEQNIGAANARNEGIKVAGGEYIGFVDSDDWVEKDLFSFLFSLIKQYDADIARCGFYFNYDDGAQQAACYDEKIKLYDYDEKISDLCTGGHISGVIWNKLYKRSALTGKWFDQTDNCSEDLLFNYRVYKDNPKTVFCDVPKCHYFIRNESLTNRAFSSGAFDVIRAKKIILSEEKDNTKIYPFAVKGFIISAFIVLSGCIQNNAFPEQAEDLKRSILNYKKDILFSGLYSKLDKIKVLLLSVSPKLYAKCIKMKGNR